MDWCKLPSSNFLSFLVGSLLFRRWEDTKNRTWFSPTAPLCGREAVSNLVHLLPLCPSKFFRILPNSLSNLPCYHSLNCGRVDCFVQYLARAR